MANNPLLKDNITDEFSVSFNQSRAWEMRDFHFHDVFEIYLAMTEGVRYFVNDRAFTLQKGDLLVFNNMDLHKTMVGKDVLYERYIVLFNPDYIRDLSTPDTDLLECFLNRGPGFVHVIHLSEQQAEALLKLCEKAAYYLSNPVYGSEIYKKLVLAELLLLVNSFYRSAEMPYIASNENEYKRIRPVIQYIHGNLGENLSLDHLAGKFYLSKYHLSSIFKKATGFSINEYIIQYRINRARELLRKGMSVSRAGESVGYNNLSHFIRTFKKLTGKSPKQYSKLNG